MNRRQFIQSTALIASTAAIAPGILAQEKSFPVVRVPETKRKFKSVAVEKTIQRVQSSIGNRELAWMFDNCFPNTLDTTVDFSTIDGRPDTYVITGDIDAPAPTPLKSADASRSSCSARTPVRASSTNPFRRTM